METTQSKDTSNGHVQLSSDDSIPWHTKDELVEEDPFANPPACKAFLTQSFSHSTEELCSPSNRRLYLLMRFVLHGRRLLRVLGGWVGETPKIGIRIQIRNCDLP